MKQLRDTLYILSDDVHLSLDGENAVMRRDGVFLDRRPLRLVNNIVSFSYKGATPALMGYCAEHGIGLAFCRPNGRFLAGVTGPVVGNIVLRREQYRIADDSAAYVCIARNMICGKLRNQKHVLDRFVRNHGERVDPDLFSSARAYLAEQADLAAGCDDPELLRGIEGQGAKAYFHVFGHLILNSEFVFNGRSKRPPLDAVNAMLSFGYSILANDCASALSAFGLDPYAGFLHRDVPGRKSLALDLMEEFRPIFVDQFVLSAINHKRLSERDFERMDSGAVLLSGNGRRTFLSGWHDQRHEIAMHPYLEEKLPRGMFLYAQAQLLSRCIRGDIDGYPPVFWR